MSYFTARVEINNHDTNDYSLLHEAMKEIIFFRAIKSDAGIWYDLPTGEYVRHSNDTIATVDLILVGTIKTLINKKPVNEKGFQKSYECFLSKCDQFRYSLKKNTDISKRSS